MQFFTVAANVNLGEIGAQVDGKFLNLCDSTGGVLASLEFDTPAFGTPADASVTINPMISDSSSGSGTIAYANISDSTGGNYFRMTVDTTGTPDILVPSLTLTPGNEVSMTSGNIFYNTID